MANTKGARSERGPGNGAILANCTVISGRRSTSSEARTLTGKSGRLSCTHATISRVTSSAPAATHLLHVQIAKSCNQLRAQSQLGSMAAHAAALQADLRRHCETWLTKFICFLAVQGRSTRSHKRFSWCPGAGCQLDGP